MARRWLLTTLVAFAALGLGGVGPAPLRILDQACGAAASDGEHRAVVIVDTGTQVRRVCVRFTEESITGRDALIRAGVDPEAPEFNRFLDRLADQWRDADSGGSGMRRDAEAHFHSTRGAR